MRIHILVVNFSLYKIDEVGQSSKYLVQNYEQLDMGCTLQKIAVKNLNVKCWYGFPLREVHGKEGSWGVAARD